MVVLKPLLLAGGKSSRMGTRKELLCLHDNEPICIHLASVLRQVCPEAETVYLSLRDRTAADDLRRHPSLLEFSGNAAALDREFFIPNVRIIYDHGEEGPIGMSEIGPAAGLLAAHHHDLAATWLVAACDYPLLTAAAMLQLRQGSTGEFACFQNSDGFCEPLLGIWTPDALRNLEQNVQRGILGPSAVVKKLQAKMVRPYEEWWLFNANTQQDWQLVLQWRKNYSSSA